MIKESTAKNAVETNVRILLFAIMPMVSFAFTEDVCAILSFLLLECSVQYQLNDIDGQSNDEQYDTDCTSVA